MAITRNLVEAMGGTIDVDSELGQGSCFEVLMDLKIAEDRTVAPVSYTHLVKNRSWKMIKLFLLILPCSSKIPL